MPSEAQLDSLLDSAVASHEAGQLDRAEALYRTVLTSDPDDLDALNLLGLLLQDRGRLDESVALLSHAVTLDPDFPEALANLARAQCACGAFEGAVANAERAASLDPNLAEAHLLYRRALLSLGRNDAAVEACQAAAARDPDSVEIQTELGLALARAGEPERSIEAFQIAIRLEPSFAPALHGLAMAYLKVRQVAPGLEFARRAIEAALDEPEYRLGLAYALRENRRVSESLAVCREVTTRAPTRADAWVLQGDNLTMLGDFRAAARCFEKALEIDAADLDAVAGLARIAQLDTDSTRAASARAVLESPDHPAQQRITAGFTLGSALDRTGRYAEAFASYAAANRLVWESMLPAADRPTDLQALSQRVDWLIEAFGPDLFQAYAGCGDASELPVFVVGMPRSGTTLVEQIAASHPRVFGAGECRDIPTIATKLEGGPPAADPSTWDKSEILRETQEYVAHLRNAAGEHVRVVDKLPDNILLLGHIALLLPHARIVVCRRDQRDTGLSCFFQHFRDAAWSTDLKDCAARMCEIERLLRHWRSVLPLSILEVQYESLVADFENQSRRLIQFLGVDWDPACLSFHEADRLVMTASSYQVRQPIYTTSVGRWRNYRQHIGELLDGVAGIASEDSAGAECTTTQQKLELARQHREAGRYPAAEAVLRSLLEEHPDTPEALHQLGSMLLARGSLKAAKPVLQRAIAQRPDEVAILLDLARLHWAQEETKDAAEIADRACQVAPDNAEAHLMSGKLLITLDENEAAAKTLSIAVTRNPDSLDARLQLGIALIRCSKFPEAAASFEAALGIDPNHVECLFKRGFALRVMNRDQEGLQCHERAAELAPDDPRVLHGLAFARWRVHDSIGTLDITHRVLQLTPDDAQMWLVQAYAQASLGRFHEAEVSFRKSLEISPDLQDAQLGLAELRRDFGDIVEAEKLRATLVDENKEMPRRVAAGFALGMVLEKSEQYDEAWAAFAEANRLALVARGRRAELVNTALIKELFSPTEISSASGWGDSSELPVFVVGMPRSGTTLVEQIAGSHPAVHPGGERKEIRDMSLRLGRGQGLQHPTRWNRLEIRKEAAWHVARMQEIAGGALRLVDKMPDNVQFLGHIGVLFPGARVILCRRDLRDVCLSCFFRRFSDDSLDWANDLRDLAYRARAINDLMDYWLDVLPLRIYEVQYEHLVTNTEAESRRLIEFLGLEWDPACLNFYEAERVVLTASQWQVRQPVYTNSIGRWKIYENHLGPLLEGLAGRFYDGTTTAGR